MSAKSPLGVFTKSTLGVRGSGAGPTGPLAEILYIMSPTYTFRVNSLPFICNYYEILLDGWNYAWSGSISYTKLFQYKVIFCILGYGDAFAYWLVHQAMMYGWKGRIIVVGEHKDFYADVAKLNSAFSGVGSYYSRMYLSALGKYDNALGPDGSKISQGIIVADRTEDLLEGVNEAGGLYHDSCGSVNSGVNMAKTVEYPYTAWISRMVLQGIDWVYIADTNIGILDLDWESGFHGSIIGSGNGQFILNLLTKPVPPSWPGY